MHHAQNHENVWPHTVDTAKSTSRDKNLLASESNFVGYPVDAFSAINLIVDFWIVFPDFTFLTAKKIKPTREIPPTIPPITLIAIIALEGFLFFC
jgi:hypothetical protein